MRRHCRFSRQALGVLVAASLLSACPDEKGAAKAAASSAAEPKDAAKQSARPPFPNMATAAWGSEVIDELEDQVEDQAQAGGEKATAEAVLRRLHSLEPGTEQELVKAAAALHRSGANDPDRSLGAALAGVGLALDPRVEGYKERLTDAHGLMSYAGTFSDSVPPAQAARALVAVAAGRIFEGQKLIGLMSTTDRLDAETALLLSLARFHLGERDDALLGQLALVLKDRPESQRGRALAVQTLLDLGLSGRALALLDEGRAATGGKDAHPWLTVLRARAEALEGAPESASGALRVALSSLDAERRGEALYLLANTELDDGSEAARGRAEALRQELAGVPGYKTDAALLGARVALLDGRSDEAKRAAEEVCKTRGLRLALALECSWVHADACAAANDADCAMSAAAKASGADGDAARRERLRAALLEGDKAAAERLREAHLLSPFDAALAARVKLPVAGGGAKAASAVRGARRALILGAPKAAAAALSPFVAELADCRVCRALDALAAADEDDGARRAAASLAGKGPPLALADLLAIIDCLGGSSLDVAKAALAKLDDKRPAVSSAIARARAEQANPEARAARMAEEAKAPEKPGTVPVPGGDPHGAAHHD